MKWELFGDNPAYNDMRRRFQALHEASARSRKKNLQQPTAARIPPASFQREDVLAFAKLVSEHPAIGRQILRLSSRAGFPKIDKDARNQVAPMKDIVVRVDQDDGVEMESNTRNAGTSYAPSIMASIIGALFGA